jgi:putative membrane protein insertion efficiency factor
VSTDGDSDEAYAALPGKGSGRRRKRFFRRRKRGKDGGRADACDVLDACDGCDGCDLFLTLSTYFLALSALAGAGRRTRRAGPAGGLAGPVPGPVPARLVVAAIRRYQRWLSPRLGARCPYTPTCSAFAAEAITRHGLAVGARATALRLRRCRPGVARGTVDPVR